MLRSVLVDEVVRSGTTAVDMEASLWMRDVGGSYWLRSLLETWSAADPCVPFMDTPRRAAAVGPTSKILTPGSDFAWRDARAVEDDRRMHLAYCGIIAVCARGSPAGCHRRQGGGGCQQLVYR